MKKILLSTSIILITTLIINANSISESFNNLTVDGYIRAAYENHHIIDDKTYTDGAIGGKLHIETAPYYGVSIGSSFYTSNALGTSDNHGLVLFRGEVANSYSILGEAYIKVQLGNTLIKLGRQEIDTPFADTDDIGLVPNTFEAYILENKDITDTTLFVGQIQKMAGVDADVVDDFTCVNAGNNMQVIGLTYEGIENLGLTAWYYHLKDAKIDSISYAEAMYEGQGSTMGYGLGLQYAKQTYATQEDATIYGIKGNVNHIPIGITLALAHNKVNGNAAFSGFGGGPFFSNSEYLIIDNTGADGSQTWFGLEYDASSIGLNGLTLSLSKVILKNQAKEASTQIDFVTSYKIYKNSEIHMIYSNLKGIYVGEDTAKHWRVFWNYTF